MKKLIAALIPLIAGNFFFAQSAERITSILKSKAVTYGDVCYLAAVGQNLVQETASDSEAVSTIFEQGILPENITAQTPANYSQVALVFSKFWKFRGNLMYYISGKNARYTFRKMKNDGVIPKNADPSWIPTGAEMLNIYTLGEVIYNPDKPEKSAKKSKKEKAYKVETTAAESMEADTQESVENAEGVE